MKLKLIRETFGVTEIIGSLYVDGKFFGYTCEDIFRDKKEFANTCIPYGKYKVKCTMSNRFKRMMPLVWNTTKDLAVTNVAGDKWLGIRIHGGNTHQDTEGCILIAKNKYTNKAHPTFSKILNWIQGSLEKELTKRLGTDIHELEIVKK